MDLNRLVERGRQKRQAAIELQQALPSALKLFRRAGESNTPRASRAGESAAPRRQRAAEVIPRSEASDAASVADSATPQVSSRSSDKPPPTERDTTELDQAQQEAAKAHERLARLRARLQREAGRQATAAAATAIRQKKREDAAAFRKELKEASTISLEGVSKASDADVMALSQLFNERIRARFGESGLHRMLTKVDLRLGRVPLLGFVRLVNATGGRALRPECF